jgi:hypothetical protein
MNTLRKRLESLLTKGDARKVLALLAAAQKVKDSLDSRIDNAPPSCVPVFDGIAELHAALAAMEDTHA